MITRFYNLTKGHIRTFCDNQPVVNKIQKGWQLLRLRHTKGPDTDLQITMRSILSTIEHAVSYKIEWLRGHQDKSTPLHAMPKEVALNVRMDDETKVAYNLPSEWHTLERMDVLPAEGCAMYIAQQKITSRLYSTLLDKWHESTARDYLMARHNIDSALFEAIQWRSMKFALLKLSYHRRATAVKAIHRHLPTQDKLFKQGRVTMCALCPRCVTQVETNAHVYSCRHPDAEKQRVRDWGELQAQLIKIHTSKIIQRTWAAYLCPLLALPPPSDMIEYVTLSTQDEIHFCLQAAIEDQDRIGWDKLLLGMGFSMWKTLQFLIDHDNPKPPRRSADDWMNRAVHQLLKFSLRCWKSRNQTVHGATLKEQKQRALDKARQQIQNVYANPPQLAPQFRSITEVPLLQRLRLPLAAAEKWLALIDHQVKVTLHNAKLLVRQHRTIPEHFHLMRQRRLRSEARTSTLPRRQHNRAGNRPRSKVHTVKHARHKPVRGSPMPDASQRKLSFPVRLGHPPIRRHPP